MIGQDADLGDAGLPLHRVDIDVDSHRDRDVQSHPHPRRVGERIRQLIHGERSPVSPRLDLWGNSHRHLHRKSPTRLYLRLHWVERGPERAGMLRRLRGAGIAVEVLLAILTQPPVLDMGMEMDCSLILGQSELEGVVDHLARLCVHADGVERGVETQR